MPRHASGFTLLELLVVIGLISALCFVLLGGLTGGGKSVALQSAQATLANLVTAARSRAMATGRPVRVLVQVDPKSSSQPVRFMRCIALQIQMAGAWQLVAETCLPEGVYVVPGNFASTPVGLFVANDSTGWVKSDGSALRSTALRSNQIISETINSSVAEQWVSITIAPTGTTAQAGDIVLALGKLREPGSHAPGESPVELQNPDVVCGVTLSIYGVPSLISGRAGF